MINFRGNNFYSSLRANLRVLGALFLREILTRYGRHNIGFLWLIVEPMMFTLGVTLLWVISGHKQGTLSITAFVLTGYSSLILWRNCANRCALAISPNLTLFYHKNVKVLDIYLSRIILEAAGATFSFIFLIIAFSYLELILWPASPHTMLLGWLLLFYYSLALGILVGVVSEASELFDRFWHVVTYILFPISGAMYIVDWLPEKVQNIVLYIPSVNATEMIREGYYGNSINFHYSISYTITACTIMLLIGLLSIGKEINISR